mgnify:FL=1
MSSRNLASRACAAGLVATLFSLPLAACSRASAASSQSTQYEASAASSEQDADAEHLLSVADIVTDRDLEGTWEEDGATKISLSDDGCAVDGAGAVADGTTVTITAGGTYVLTGQMSAGQVVVNADGEKVQLVLDGASVTSTDSAAILVRAAKKVWLTLADGTQNKLATSDSFAEDDEYSIDGAVWCKSDLTINGTGALTVSSAEGHGIVCKDELALVSGDVEVEAARHAVQAQDAACVVAGTWSLTAGTDGIHCGDDDDAEKGSVLIVGGTVSIDAASDGVDAANVLEVDGGEVTVSAGDDGLHSERALQVDGGEVTVSAGDDGLHSERALQVDGGTVTVTKSYEGLEGSTVTVNGGVIDVTSSDDGVNAAGDPTGDSSAEAADAGASGPEAAAGQPGDPMGGGQAPAGDGRAPEDADAQAPTSTGQVPAGSGGQVPEDAGGQAPEDAGGQAPGADGDMDYDSTAQVTINGGKLTIQAGGDGIDSNGNLTVTGGETYVFGPVSDGDGSLDFAGTGTSTGGVVMCAGSSGMAQNFADASTQGSMLVSASGQAGDAIQLVDEDENVVASCEARTSYSCVLVSAPGVESGKTYTLTCGDASSEITMDGLVYSNVDRVQAGGPGSAGKPQGSGQPQQPAASGGPAEPK